MSNTRNTTAGIAAEIAKGWQPNNYLPICHAYFQKPEDYVAHQHFPGLPGASCPLLLLTRQQEDPAATTCQLSRYRSR